MTQAAQSVSFQGGDSGGHGSLVSYPRALSPKREHAAGEGLPLGRVLLGHVTNKWDRSKKRASLGSSNAQYYFLQDQLLHHEAASVTFLGCSQDYKQPHSVPAKDAESPLTSILRSSRSC